MPFKSSDFKHRFRYIKNRCFKPLTGKKTTLDRISHFTEEVDKLLLSFYTQQTDSTALNSDMCLLALGGYGRKELCPQSDIDLLILYQPETSQSVIENLVRSLWDLGFPLGCVVRTIPECKRILGQEIETDTAFLQARYLAGNHTLYHKLENSIIQPYFRRHRGRYINQIRKIIISRIFNPSQTIFHIEPDIKNGICGLRDCHRMLWSERIRTGADTLQELGTISNFATEDVDKFRQGYEFLISLRTEMHLFHNRRIDILEAAFQEAIAKRMGFTETGLLLETYFKSVKDIKSFAAAFIEQSNLGEGLLVRIRRRIASVRIQQNICYLDGIFYPLKSAIKPEALTPGDILTYFQLSLRYRALLSHDFCNIIRYAANRFPSRKFIAKSIYTVFRNILSHPAPGQTLVQMLETNVLEKIIPEFRDLICKVEYDTYHEYTVDQHTLLMVAGLDRIPEDGRNDLYKIYRRIKNKFLLRLSFLLHDIGKSMPGDHAKNGAIIASRIGNRLGLNQRELDQIQFLIFNHLILSDFTFTHEWEKEGVKEISKRIQNKTNLDMLYLLTVMDIKNVGSKTWTEWKGIQLKELYTEIRKILDQVRRKAKEKNEKEEKVPSYSFFDSDQHNYHMWINRFKQTDDTSIVHLYTEDFIGFIRLTVVGCDRKNFFTDIVSCISSEGYNILSAKILSTKDGIVLDIFHLEPDILTLLSTESRINNIHKKWKMIQTGKADAYGLIDDRLKHYPSPVSDRIRNEKTFILVNNKKSLQYTVLEVKTRDRFGLLFRIAHILSRFEINIVSAKLSTRIDRVVDVFYINTLSGKKIEDPVLISGLEETLKSQLI